MNSLIFCEFCIVVNFVKFIFCTDIKLVLSMHICSCVYTHYLMFIPFTMLN